MTPKITLPLIILVCALTNSALAQTQEKKSEMNLVPENMRSYQFQLDRQAKEISNLHYEKTGEPVKGGLSPDGKRVILNNYIKGNRVAFHIIYVDGIEKDTTKSPCYIDPITMEL